MASAQTTMLLDEASETRKHSMTSRTLSTGSSGVGANLRALAHWRGAAPHASLGIADLLGCLLGTGSLLGMAIEDDHIPGGPLAFRPGVSVIGAGGLGVPGGAARDVGGGVAGACHLGCAAGAT